MPTTEELQAEVERLQVQLAAKTAEVERLRAAAGVPTKCPSCGKMIARRESGEMATWPPRG